MNYQFRRKHIEAFVWIGALGTLIFFNPGGEKHASLCLFKNLTGEFCPGCGLGHSISWFFRGHFEASFKNHPLGIPAVIILLIRSFNLLKNEIQIAKQT